jgi:transcriptional regulator with XRE-family HTH domain
MNEAEAQGLIGARLRAYRALAQMTLREASSKIEMTFQYIHRLEVGLGAPSFSTLLKFANAYGCTVGDFFVDVDARLREEQQKGGFLVDEAAAARANYAELIRAIAYLTDLADRNSRIEDAKAFKRAKGEAVERRRGTLKGKK